MRERSLCATMALVHYGEKEEEKLGVGRKWQGLLKGRKQKPQTSQLGPGSMISQKKGVYSKKLHLQPQVFRRSLG